MLETLNFGSCCRCRGTYGVVNVLMLNQRAPIPGKGWGCLQCGLPNDGAIAVLCDACLDMHAQQGASIPYVCAGYPSDDVRSVNIGYPKDFDHDMSLHPEAEAGRKSGAQE